MSTCKSVLDELSVYGLNLRNCKIPQPDQYGCYEDKIASLFNDESI